jgi:hypothetical protein
LRQIVPNGHTAHGDCPAAAAPAAPARACLSNKRKVPKSNKPQRDCWLVKLLPRAWSGAAGKDNAYCRAAACTRTTTAVVLSSPRQRYKDTCTLTL